jgi:branched-subunit amino acid transport protein
MSWASYLIILGCCMATILVCRVVPALALKGRELPARLEQALELIPPAAFAALVANDLLNLDLLTTSPIQFALPWFASLAVVVVAIKTRSLTWCIIVGVAVLGLLMLVPL